MWVVSRDNLIIMDGFLIWLILQQHYWEMMAGRRSGLLLTPSLSLLWCELLCSTMAPQFPIIPRGMTTVKLGTQINHPVLVSVALMRKVSTHQVWGARGSSGSVLANSLRSSVPTNDQGSGFSPHMQWKPCVHSLCKDKRERARWTGRGVYPVLG